MPRKPRPIRVEGDLGFVSLAGDLTAVIDASDVPLVSGYCWLAHKGRYTNYAGRTDYTCGKKRWQMMHRLIMDCPDGMVVDHIDGDGLNNRRSNLRLALPSQNASNRKRHSNNTSGHTGVYFHQRDGDWRARISVNGSRRHLGSFSCQEAAMAAYAEASAALHGEFRRGSS